MTQKNNYKNIIFENSLIISLFLIAIIFIIDLNIPTGRSFWFFFVLPVFYSVRYVKNINIIYPLVALIISLIFIDHFLSVPGIENYISLQNRFIGSLVILIVAFFMIQARKALEKLSESERHFSDAIKFNPNPVMITDEDGKIISINEIWTKITGYTLNEIPNIETWFEKAFGNISGELMIDAQNILEKNKKVHYGGLKLLTKNGEKRVWDFSVYPIAKYQNGKRLLIISAIDITDKQKFETELIQQKDRAEKTSEFSKAISNLENDLQKIIDYSTEKISKFYGDAVTIRLFSHDRKWLTYGSIYHSDARIVDQLMSVLKNSDYKIETFIDEAVNTRKPVIINDFEETFDIKNSDINLSSINNSRISSGIFVPLKNSGKVAGIISIYSIDSARKFTENDKKFFEEIAARIAIRINNTELFLESKRETEKSKQLGILLSEREKLLEKMLEILPVGIWFLNDSGSIMRGNKKAEEIWGGIIKVGIENFIDFKGWDTLTGKRLQSKDWAAAKSILNGESFFNEIIDIESFDNKRKTILNSSVPLKDENNKIIGALVVNQDITELREIENELRREKGLLNSILENSPVFISVIGLNGNMLLANKVIFDMLDIPSHENFVGKNIYDIFSKEMADQLWQNDLKALNSSSPIQVEEIVKHKDGTFHTYMTVKFPVKQAGSNEIYGICAISTDFTDLKNAEIALRESHERFEQMSETMPQLVWTSQPDGKLDYFNSHWVDFTGYSKDEGYGFGWEKIIHPEDFQKTYDVWINSINTGNMYSIEHRFKKKDGNYLWHLSRALPIKDGEKIIKWIGTSTDIHSQKDYQDKLNKAMEELERSNKELEQFAYTVSHDLQEPVRMIKSYSQMITRKYLDKIDKDANEYLNFINSGATRMQFLISDLLKLSRITTKAKPFEKVSVNSIVEEVIDDLRFKIEDASATIEFAELLKVYGEPTQIRQIFQNLIQNSLKFKNDRDPVIKINSVQENEMILFTVSDNGIGIAKEHQKLIFEIFQRLHGREEFEGTGIGLALVKKIVERHGGKIWVESEPGKGSTFFFTLPAFQENSI